MLFRSKFSLAVGILLYGLVNVRKEVVTLIQDVKKIKTEIK